ncbi:MAG: Gfo/Idh/MocA family oxidoreductase [Chloroflexi bacterium]|nr:Gfo/Idh/MocA family oxidoreductase [Chloroflexota bacterium]
MTQRKVKVGIVGCGVVATAYYLPYLMRMPEAEITAVCDIYEGRTAACVRLFGAREQYRDYYEMIRRADLDAVFILTGPGTHVPFTLAAVETGKHVLLQKPMALTLDEANKITAAVRRAGVKTLIEPSQNSPLEPAYGPVMELIRQGVLGAPYWFTLIPGAATTYHASLGGNPYGAGAFYTEDSGGILFDFPYAPSQIVTLLGPCKSVMGSSTISVPDRYLVPEEKYNEFLAGVTDPDQANYWDVVLDLPKTEHIRTGAPDNVFSLYEMANGWTGVFHAGRPFHPVPKGFLGGLHIYGSAGNLFMGGGHFASIISSRRDLLPHVDADGWYRIPVTGDPSKTPWPKPTFGGFNYYHASTQHLIDCILQDRDPIVNVEWGRHITEMMYGAVVSARTGKRYEMTTTLTG